MDTAALKMLFETDHHILHAHLDGLTHEQSMFQPQPAGNCLNWILGHLVASRNSIFRLLGEKPIWTEEQAAIYERGTEPLTDAEKATPFGQILADFDRSQDRLLPRLDTVTPAELAAPGGQGDRSVGQMLNFLQFHETYHTGQVGLLRRLLGLDGVIK